MNLNLKKKEIQDEALTVALTHHKCGLEISMGVGKTLIGLRYIQYFLDINPDIKVLIVGSTTIVKSWKKEMSLFGYTHLLKNISFTTYLSLPKQNKEYDIVVLDEAHNLRYGATNFLNNYVNRILGLTGTSPRFTWSEKGQMMEKFYPIKYRYRIEQAISDDLINDYRIFVHLVELGTNKNIPVKTRTGNVFYQSEVDSYNYWSSRIASSEAGTKDRQILTIMRMKAMMTFKTKELYAKSLFYNRCSGKTIIFCNTITQAQAMCYNAYYSGKHKGHIILDEFKKGVIKKMSCVLMLNEGENIPGLRNAVILHSYGNEKKLAQRLGRCLRLNPNDCSNIHIMCYKNTIDEKWVNDALEAFDSTKIKYLN